MCLCFTGDCWWVPSFSFQAKVQREMVNGWGMNLFKFCSLLQLKSEKLCPLFFFYVLTLFDPWSFFYCAHLTKVAQVMVEYNFLLHNLFIARLGRSIRSGHYFLLSFFSQGKATACAFFFRNSCHTLDRLEKCIGLHLMQSVICLILYYEYCHLFKVHSCPPELCSNKWDSLNCDCKDRGNNFVVNHIL